MIDRIAKLLNKAERAETPEEAQTYFDKAQALATSHSISLAKARLHTTGSRRIQPINKTIRIGDARRHINKHLVNLMIGLSAANDLKMDVAHNSTYVIVYGFPGDIVAVEELWTRISTQMVRFGEAFLATDSWRSEDRYVYSGEKAGQQKMTRQAARSSYYGSFINTVCKRIQKTREESVRQQTAADHGQPGRHTGATEDGRDDAGGDAGIGAVGTEVALRAKEVAVADFYGSKSKARGSWRGDRDPTSTPSKAAISAGVRDGHKASLSDQATLTGRKPALSK